MNFCLLSFVRFAAPHSSDGLWSWNVNEQKQAGNLQTQQSKMQICLEKKGEKNLKVDFRLWNNLYIQQNLTG